MIVAKKNILCQSLLTKVFENESYNNQTKWQLQQIL